MHVYKYLWTGEIIVALEREVKPLEISTKHRLDKVDDWEIKKKGKNKITCYSVIGSWRVVASLVVKWNWGKFLY